MNPDEMPMWQPLEAAISYLKNIYDTNTLIVSIRTIGWTKTGIAIGTWIYAR